MLLCTSLRLSLFILAPFRPCSSQTPGSRGCRSPWLNSPVKSVQILCLVKPPSCVWAPLPVEEKNRSKHFCGFANRGSYCAAPSGGQSQALCSEQELQQGSFIVPWGGREPSREGLGQWHRLFVKAVRISSRCLVPHSALIAHFSRQLIKGLREWGCSAFVNASLFSQP